MKADEKEKIEKMEKLISEAERSPVIKQLRETEAQETLTKRRAAADRITDLTLDLEACRVIQKEIDGLVLKLAELDAEREKMKTAINEKLSFMWKEKGGVEGQIRQQQEILYNSYNEKIDEGIDFFKKKLDFLRTDGRISRNPVGSERNLFTWTKKTKSESNIQAVHDALQYCQGAIAKLQDMKLRPDFDLQEIEALKDGIPKIDIYSEITGEKPLEKGHDASFLAKMEKETVDRINYLLGKKVF